MASDEGEFNQETLAAYEEHSAQYIDATSAVRSALVDELLALTDPGDTVLELGSGPGRDAAALETAGLRVDRTDGAMAFVEHLKRTGKPARRLNVFEDDFGGPFDAIFANAVLLHVPRSRLAGVLRVARRATAPGGVLVASFKKGSGDGWSRAKLSARRHFTYWDEAGLVEALTAAGWMPLRVEDTTSPTSAQRWISVAARNGS